jgi:hypothetical protein
MLCFLMQDLDRAQTDLYPRDHMRRFAGAYGAPHVQHCEQRRDANSYHSTAKETHELSGQVPSRWHASLAFQFRAVLPRLKQPAYVQQVCQKGGASTRSIKDSIPFLTWLLTEPCPMRSQYDIQHCFSRLLRRTHSDPGNTVDSSWYGCHAYHYSCLSHYKQCLDQT